MPTPSRGAFCRSAMEPECDKVVTPVIYVKVETHLSKTRIAAANSYRIQRCLT